MKHTNKFAIALVTATALGAALTVPVFANPGHGAQGGWTQKTQGAMGGMMGGQGGQGGMMGNQGGMMGGQGGMMGGHGGMMGGMGGPGMMGGLFGDLDADGDGTVTPEEAHEGMQAALEKFDANGDGSLSLEEFQALHSDAIRSRMVDRFQALDEDGDGKVTADEITAPADQMSRTMQAFGGATDDTDADTDDGN